LWLWWLALDSNLQKEQTKKGKILHDKN
jgi:hypothetical protein